MAARFGGLSLTRAGRAMPAVALVAPWPLPKTNGRKPAAAGMYARPALYLFVGDPWINPHKTQSHG